MIVSITNDQKNNLFIATVSTEVDSLDMAYMDALGEPQIDQAGTIPYTDSLSQPQTFVIGGGPKNAYVRSGMPISFALQLSLDPEAKGKVAGWGIEMKNRIIAAMTTLKANPVPNVPNTARFQV